MVDGRVACARLSVEQHGVLSKQQALQHLSRRQLKRQLASGAWVTVLPGTYRVLGAPATERQQHHALDVWLGPRGVLSHRTAARVHGLDVAEAQEVTARLRLQAPPGVKVYRRALGTNDTAVVEGLVVTRLERTLVDLAACLDASELKEVVQQALRLKKLTLDELRRAVDRSKRAPGIRMLRALAAELDGQGGPTESVLEDKVLELLEAAELPKPKVQRPARAGKKRVRLDFFFEAQKVVIEADGYAWHSDVESFEKDRRRSNALMARGYRVLHWTWKALEEDPEHLVTELLLLLNRSR